MKFRFVGVLPTVIMAKRPYHLLTILPVILSATYLCLRTNPLSLSRRWMPSDPFQLHYIETWVSRWLRSGFFWIWWDVQCFCCPSNIAVTIGELYQIVRKTQWRNLSRTLCYKYHRHNSTFLYIVGSKSLCLDAHCVPSKYAKYAVVTINDCNKVDMVKRERKII
jgi:hypothetical protein